MDLICKEGEAVHTFKWRPFLRQAFASSTTWVTYFMLGLSLGTPTVTIPQLRREANSTLSINDEMTSWISSISGYVAIAFIVGLALMAYYYGQRKSILLAEVNSFLAFLILYCSRNATDVLVSQLFQGMMHASTSTISLLLVAECTSPRYRGIFLTIKSATAFWGIWSANAIGTFYNYRNIGLVGIICSIYSIVSTLIIPESPYWLASKKRYEQCAKAHRWLKGDDENEERELQHIIKKQKEENLGNKTKATVRDYIILTLNNMRDPELYKPIALSVLVTSMYHFSGKLVCTVYSIEMIKKITGSESTAYTGMLILDGFTVLGMYIGCVLSKYFKRRTLLLSASIAATFFLYVITVYLYLKNFFLVPENHIITITLLTCYSLAICCGPLILSSSIYAELIPVRSRNFSMCFISFFSIFTLATLFKISPYLFEDLGFEGTFLFFAIISTIIIILVYFYLPETKDKSLHEIADMFKKEKRIVSNPAESTLLP